MNEFVYDVNYVQAYYQEEKLRLKEKLYLK
jgi:hypothetical protein